jgi:nucleoside-triphosphatase
MILDRADRDIRGFVTEDIRYEGERVGFMVEFDNGESRVLSHVDFEDGPMVGKYTVDLETMDWVVDMMETWKESSADLLIVDEVGKMELKHEDFPECVEEVLEADTDVLATMPRVGPDFVGDIRSRDDVEKLELKEDTREEILTELVDMLNIEPEN